jgi:16S rRNA (uracil1498-N3)-methyltransferase
VSLAHFFAGAPAVGERVVLEGEDARHAAGSRRLRPGDRITSGDGLGAMTTCRVEVASREAVEAQVLERWEVPPPSPRLRVCVAPPKGERLSWAVQKLTEIGVDAITLLETARTVRHPPGLDRLARVARQAAKQSGRPRIPPVDGPMPWGEAVAGTEGLVVVLWEEATEGLLGLLPPGQPEAVTLFVGPEGGLAPEEAREAGGRGALLASLGPTLLRTETAALAAASVVLARYGRMG